MVSLSSVLRYQERMTTSLNLVPSISVGKEPLINEEFYSEVPYGLASAPIPSYKLLWDSFKRTPEMVALFTAIVEDILSDGWTLEGGRNNRIEAEKFLGDNHAKQTLSSFLFDALVTGDGYLYKSKLNEQQVDKIVSNTVSKVSGKQDRKMTDAIISKIKYQQPSVFKVKRFKCLPASTMLAKFDIHGTPLQYVQTVGSKDAEFTPDEVAHWSYLSLDGKFYGFTPMVSVLREIETISSVKDYAKFFFDKGGVPNFMFILKNENPDSPTHKAFKKALQLYATLSNKYKSMVLTGDVEVKELNRMTKDMEYRELARYLTTILVMVWGVPSSRLSEMLYSTGARGIQTSSEGYYRKISHYQDILEDFINSELLSEYGVKLRFKKTYKQDEVREVQIEKIKTDVVEQRLKLGLVNTDWAWRYLEIEEIYRGDPETTEEKSGLRNQDQLNNLQMLSESEEKLVDNTIKQSSAIKNKI